MLVLAIIALGIPLAINLSSRVRAEVRTQAQAQADLVAATAADLLAPGQRQELATLAQTAARQLRGRILIVNAAGGVLVDSTGAAPPGTSYESRPELKAALAGHPIQVQRNSRTLGKAILATAVPIIRNSHPVGAVRVTQSIAAVNGAVHRAQLGLILIGLIVLALGLLAGGVIARQVSRPMLRLEQVARRIAQGDLDARAELEGSTEQRSLATSFNEMAERIGRLLGAQRAFVADASHQLRTPLTGLRLRLEAARAAEGDEATRDQMDAAVGEVDRLAHTVEELLVLSSGGERQLRGTLVDLHDVAEAAIDRWEATARSRGIRLLHGAEAGRADVWVSRPDVDRALDSLVENALKYSPEGSAVEMVDGPGRIEVRDRGPGIPADELEIVFDRFHRGRAGQGGPAGSGLGLSIARELARAWGGDVTIANRGGGGVVATLRLARGVGTSDDPASLQVLNPEPSSVGRR